MDPARALAQRVRDALALAPGAARIARLDAVLRERDNRLIVRDWISDNVPAGSTLHQAVPGAFMRGSQWARIELYPPPELIERDLERLVAVRLSERRLRALAAELRATGRAGFEEVGFDSARARFVSWLGDPAPEPRYVLVARPPVRRLPAAPAALREILARDYTLLRSFETGAGDGAASVYDHQDAFFVPFAGFAGVERPGPSYDLYERRGPS